MCPEAPSGWICTKFGLGCPPADVINCGEFCCCRFRFCEGSKFAISHWLGRSPLTQCWRYRAACDGCVKADWLKCLDATATFNIDESAISGQLQNFLLLHNYTIYVHIGIKPASAKMLRNITKECQEQECWIQALTDLLLCLLPASPPVLSHTNDTWVRFKLTLDTIHVNTNIPASE